jgi:uncharacterized protein YgiB involved in biofilm formation
MALKRTRHLALTTLMASAAVNLSACGQPSAPSDALTWDESGSFQTASNEETVDALTYSDLNACRAADQVPDADCDTAWETAQQDHLANAPRFGDKAACEAEYGQGNCETRTSSGGGSFFMPFLGGMILGQMLNPGGGRYYRGTGLYRDRYGRFTTPYGRGGLSRDYATGRTQIARSAIEPPASARSAPARYAPSRTTAPRTVSRGGFRSSGRSYGGYGG